jgi:uncharacterized protein
LEPSQRVHPDEDLNTRSLLSFFALSFGLSWGILGLLLVFPEALEATFGPLGLTNPLFILAVYAPGIVGVGLVAARGGGAAVGRYLGRLLLWRMPWAWWVLLVVGMPAVFFAGAVLKGPLELPYFGSGGALFGAMAAALLIGPVEELGWRGVALPLLQRTMAPVWAALVLGVIWALWHVPAFALSGTPQSSWSLPAFFIGVVSLSLILTPMFNASGGSILIAALFHFQANGPLWPDAQPWDTPLFLLLAIVVVWARRDRMLRRADATTRVIPPAEPSVSTQHPAVDIER